MTLRHAVAAAVLLAVAAPSASGQKGEARTVAVRGQVTGEDVVRTARRYLGVPYKWGGTTPKAFDCSGFTKHVFGHYGIQLPRTAREQSGVGVAPYPGDLQPGDLLFFYGGRGAQHLAIYVGGDTIIHASSTGGRVRYDVLGKPGQKRGKWFRQRLIAVRRVLPAEGVFRIPVGSGGVAGARGTRPPEAAREAGATAAGEGSSLR